MNPLPLAGSLAVIERRQEPLDQNHSGADIGDRRAGTHRTLPGKARDRHKSRHSLDDLIDAGTRGIRTLCPKPEMLPQMMRGFICRNDFVVDAEPMLDVGTKAFEDDVRTKREFREDRLSLGGLQIKDRLCLLR